MAGWNAITGARGIVAAFLMSALLQLGLVDVTTGLLLCAASSAVGVVAVRADEAGRAGRDACLGGLVVPGSRASGLPRPRRPPGAASDAARRRLH